MSRKITIEIWAGTLADCRAIQDGGGDRIELCGPGEGGVTPSMGVIEQARKAVDIALNVMIRPRGGRREYLTDLMMPEEVEAMKQDIRRVRDLGVDGLVIGVRKLAPAAAPEMRNGVRVYSTKSTVVDVETMDYLLEDFRDKSSTFHCGWGGRIQDMLEVMKIEGIDRVLHGPLDESKIRVPADVERGEENIRKLMEVGGTRVAILPVTNMSFDVLEQTLQRLPLTELYLGRDVSSGYPQRGGIDARKIRQLSDFVDSLNLEDSHG